MTDRRSQYSENHRFQSVIESDTSMMSDNEKDLITRAMNKEWTNPKYKMRYFVVPTCLQNVGKTYYISIYICKRVFNRVPNTSLSS